MKYQDYQLMSNEIKNKIVPKLRFPEFTLAPGWGKTILGKVTYPVNEKNKESKKYPIYSINNVEGFLPQSDQFEGVNSHDRGYDISLYKIIQKNTFAYNPARINIGSLGYSGELNDIIISSLYVCFKTSEEIDDLFLWCFLKSEIFNRYVKMSVEGGIRSYLFYENFAKIEIQFPQISEQKKIAACLSSLDDLITAESQKLDAYRAHKKGMMQQLFPAEGETVPELRFAEFRDNEVWVEKTLGSICTNIASGKDKVDENGEFNLYGSTGIIGKTDSGSYDGNFILVARVGANAGLLNRVNGKFGVTDNTLVIFLYESENLDFVYYILEKSGLNKLVFGSGQPLITGGQLKNFIIYLPKPEEQQKIATCLSSLDELITTQTEKIETLKVHKKGLMQGLFTNIN